jgi:hypothetical protein
MYVPTLRERQDVFGGEKQDLTPTLSLGLCQDLQVDAAVAALCLLSKLLLLARRLGSPKDLRTDSADNQPSGEAGYEPTWITNVSRIVWGWRRGAG